MSIRRIFYDGYCPKKHIKATCTIDQAAAFIAFFMACKELAQPAMIAIRLMRVRMISFMEVSQHAHIMMQRAVRHRNALRQAHAQHQPD